ncbi:hypothetical protein JCM11491_001609 [Sporobolomyces phaffii]
MPIKLLQHKSWHVYSQENIARVKRDEAAAALDRDAQDRRTLLADSEARIDRMKHKKRRTATQDDPDGERQLERHLAGRPRPESDPESTRDSDGMTTSRGHLNFWAHLEAASASGPSTPAETATLDRRINQACAKSVKQSQFDDLTKVYLAKKGEGEPKGWYASADGKTDRERQGGDEATLERTYRDNETKRLVDPLALMNSYLQRRDDIRSGHLDPRSTRRPPSTRDRYLEPASSSSTPRDGHSRSRPDDLEPVVERLLRARRPRGDRAPPPPPPSAPPPRPAAVAPTPASLGDRSSLDPEAEARRRVSAERAKTAALLAAKRNAASASGSSVASMTPRSEYGAHEGGYGMFNREEVREARQGRANGGWGARRERRGEKERESRESWSRAR